MTSLPILVKGLLSADDADRALDAGVDGIVVSNHGGRQVDSAIAALDALPGVVDRVDGRVPVLMDSGIRSGADIVHRAGARGRCRLRGPPLRLRPGAGRRRRRARRARAPAGRARPHDGPLRSDLRGRDHPRPPGPVPPLTDRRLADRRT